MNDRQRFFISRMNEYDKIVIANGCRPEWLSKKIPDKLENILKPYFDEIFKSDCNIHDYKYYIGGNEQDKKIADKDFYKAMKQSVKRNAHWYSRLWFYYKAWQYYRLVKKFGNSAFNFKAPITSIKQFPSFYPYKDQKLRDLKIQTIFINNRWEIRR